MLIGETRPIKNFPPEKCNICKKYKMIGYTIRNYRNRTVKFECERCYNDRRMIEEL